MKVIGALTLDRSAVPDMEYTIVLIMLSRLKFRLYYRPRLAMGDEQKLEWRLITQACGGRLLDIKYNKLVDIASVCLICSLVSTNPSKSPR